MSCVLSDVMCVAFTCHCQAEHHGNLMNLNLDLADCINLASPLCLYRQRETNDALRIHWGKGDKMPSVQHRESLVKLAELGQHFPRPPIHRVIKRPSVHTWACYSGNCHTAQFMLLRAVLLGLPLGQIN